MNQREHCLGLSYVAVSQVKTIDGILFEKSLDFELFKHKESAMSQDRDTDWVLRTEQL